MVAGCSDAMAAMYATGMSRLGEAGGVFRDDFFGIRGKRYQKRSGSSGGDEALRHQRDALGI